MSPYIYSQCTNMRRSSLQKAVVEQTSKPPRIYDFLLQFVSINGLGISILGAWSNGNALVIFLEYSLVELRFRGWQVLMAKLGASIKGHGAMERRV